MLSRRSILKGMGVSMTLPWLESVQGKEKMDSGRPLRGLFIFMPNGFIMPSWKPEGQGKDYKLSETLQVMKPFKNDFTLYSNLTHDKARANGDGGGDHARSSGTYLTSRQMKKTSGNDIRAGVSVDQIIAAKVGSHTDLPSLEVGCERGQLAGNCDSGYSCAYSGNISWKNEKLPMVKEVNPRLVFARLFGDPKQHLSRREKARRAMEEVSILDLVREESKSLMGKVSSADQYKLNEYIESVRSVEKRLQNVEKNYVNVEVPQMPKGVPSDFKTHLRLMYDLIVLAFQADKTRIGTLMLGNAGSNRRYDFLGQNEGHHALSHHGNDQKKVDMIKQIDKFHVEQFAYFVRRLKETKDGDSNLLYNSMIMLGSGIADGNRHSHHDLPTLIAGNACGKFETGLHKVAPKDTPIANFYLSLMDMFGAHEKSFGDSNGRYI